MMTYLLTVSPSLSSFFPLTHTLSCPLPHSLAYHFTHHLTPHSPLTSSSFSPPPPPSPPLVPFQATASSSTSSSISPPPSSCTAPPLSPSTSPPTRINASQTKPPSLEISPSLMSAVVTNWSSPTLCYMETWLGH